MGYWDDKVLTQQKERDRMRAELEAPRVSHAALAAILEAILRAWDGGLYRECGPAKEDHAAKWMGLGNHDEGSREPSVTAFYDALARGRSVLAASDGVDEAASGPAGGYTPERAEQATSDAAPATARRFGTPKDFTASPALPNSVDDVRTGAPAQAATTPPPAITLAQWFGPAGTVDRLRRFREAYQQSLGPVGLATIDEAINALALTEAELQAFGDKCMRRGIKFSRGTVPTTWEVPLRTIGEECIAEWRAEREGKR